MSSKHFSRISLSTFFALFFSVECASAKATKYTPIMLDSIVIIVPFIPNKPNPISKGLLKKTGQTKSYDEDGILVTNGSIKDDGYYQKGITPRYSRANDVVIDHITRLEWQDDIEVSIVTKNWKDALSYCSGLSLNGSGWRLPTRKELLSLSDYRGKESAISPVFGKEVYGYYWSFTAYAGDKDIAWLVYFYNGSHKHRSKNNTEHVRCVRTGQ